MIKTVLDFINVLEDEKYRLSWTKIALIVTTLMSVGTLSSEAMGLMTFDSTVTTAVLAANAAAGVKHEVKRWTLS